MRPELAVHAAEQDGLVTRHQALVAGYTERELRTLTGHGGAWVVVRRGVYLERSQWDALRPWDGQMAVRDRAAHLSMERMHVLSHDSAARAHGLTMLRGASQLVHVTRPVFTGGRTEQGVKHHIARVQPGEIETVRGLPVTALARTAVDLAREHGIPAGVVACDAARRRGVTIPELDVVLGGMRNWPNVTRARAAADLSNPGAESAGESLARLLVDDLGFGPSETQFPVDRGGGRTAWGDLRLGRLIIEFDGRRKYVDRAGGGYADRPVEDVLWDERTRELDMRRAGFGVARLIWVDLMGRERSAAIRRLRAEYAETYARYGDELTPEQGRFAVRMAAARRDRVNRRLRVA